jgi:hypothetical protein
MLTGTVSCEISGYPTQHECGSIIEFGPILYELAPLILRLNQLNLVRRHICLMSDQENLSDTLNTFSRQSEQHCGPTKRMQLLDIYGWREGSMNSLAICGD